MRILNAHGGVVFALAYTPDGSRLLAATTPGAVHVYDTASGVELLNAWITSAFTRPFDLAVAPEGGYFAAGGSQTRLTFRNLATGSDVSGPASEIGYAHGLAFSPDGRLFVATHLTGRRRYSLDRWSVATREQILPSLLTDQQPIQNPTFSRDGQTLAVSFMDCAIRLFDMASGEERTDDRLTARPEKLTFLPDGQTLAVLLNRCVVLWDVERGRERARLEGQGRLTGALAVSPDGQFILTAGQDHTVHLWDANTAVCRASFDWKVGVVGAVAFAPDGMTAAAGGERGEIVIWDVDERAS
jgi:WD40 repeat protein